MHKRIHYDALRNAARGQTCVRCGVEDGTVVLAHYFGPRRHEYGGGMSRKGHDVIGAHLCHRCHAHMDSGWSQAEIAKWEHSEEFLHLCALTIIRLVNSGYLKVGGNR